MPNTANNHELWRTCADCGHEYDARLYGWECPKCGGQPKNIDCKISNWNCVYHACLTNHCQKPIVIIHQFYGPGQCEKNRSQIINHKTHISL